jgi:hypothetical protein
MLLVNIPVTQVSIMHAGYLYSRTRYCLTTPIYTFWVWTSDRVPIYALYNDLAPKPIRDVGEVPGDEAQKQVVPEDDEAGPVDGEVTADGQIPLLRRKGERLLSAATSPHLLAFPQSNFF